MKFKYSVLVIFFGLLLCLLYISPESKSPHDLIIYDVHGDSPRIVMDDESIEMADYVRIRNMTDHSYDLSGLYLSDSEKDLKKLPLAGLIIDAGSSQMIKLDPSWNFALKSSGDESVYLSDDDGSILFRYTQAMKPDKPVLSAQSGFYDKEFDLKMTVKGNYIIHYTLDGSEPGEDSEVYAKPIRVYDRSDEDNSVVNVVNTVKDYFDEYSWDDDAWTAVEKPIEEPVDKAFIVRAVAMDEYGNKSDIVTSEYFFCGNKYKNIISVVADPDDLFGDYGIVSVGKEYDNWYLNGKVGDAPTVNYKKKGREWEVPADMAYFKENRMVLRQKCGLRLQGRKTRDRRIKNFQLRARNCYSGSEVFEYDFFEGETYRSDAIVLKDGFEEAFLLSLIDNERILKQKTTDRVALFLNGEFWNDIYIRQRLDEKFFEDHYGVSDDNLLVLSESFPEISPLEWDDSIQMYLDLHDFIENNDLSTDENYKIVQDMMDIDSYIDYLAINEWNGNRDWGEFNNDMYWRVLKLDGSRYGDGKFRWIIHDEDLIFNTDSDISNISMIRGSTLYNGLMGNENFRKRFRDRLAELGETTFSDESVMKELSNAKWDEKQKEEIKEFFKTRKETVERFLFDT